MSTYILLIISKTNLGHLVRVHSLSLRSSSLAFQPLKLCSSPDQTAPNLLPPKQEKKLTAIATERA